MGLLGGVLSGRGVMLCWVVFFNNMYYLHILRRDAGPLDGTLDRDCSELGSFDGGELATKAAETGR